MRRLIEHLILGQSPINVIIMITCAIIMLSVFFYGWFLIARGLVEIRRNRREKSKEKKQPSQPQKKENEPQYGPSVLEKIIKPIMMITAIRKANGDKE